MSEGNVETVRRATEAWERNGIEGLIEFASPDAVVYAFPEWPSDPVYHGKDGWRELLSEWTASFDEMAWEVERIESVNDKVMVATRVEVTISGTQAPIVQRYASVFGDFKGDGTVGEARFFLTWAEALKAAGLSE
jgi:ketosteroid isomerase-like protein